MAAGAAVAVPAEAAVLTTLGVVGEPFDGVGWVRFGVPFRHLAARGHALRTLGSALALRHTGRGYEPDGSILDGVDLVVFPQTVASPRLADGAGVEVVAPLCEAAARRGIPVVYSADDHLAELDPSNPGWAVVHGSRGNLETILAAASGAVVTTEPLRRALAPRGLDARVLPNAVDPDVWRPRPRRGGRLRVGWAGSGSHLDDLLLVMPALRELQRRVDCTVVVAGLTDVTLERQAAAIAEHRDRLDPDQRRRAERFLALHAGLGELRCEHHPFAPLARYVELLPALDLDVGLCPLLDTPFNRCKSALKFYEYAAVGTMTVASRVAPYDGEVSVTVPDDAGAWADTLERLLRDPVAREGELARQREFVLRERTIGRWIDGWDATLRDFAGRRSTGP